ncbi:MAG TPA: acyl-[acyl-carrier-protein]--UDP-N-acetylglucosamine O-acyltransferase [Bacteroidales bacterium]|nr:acyl-[acyl-carrier-protein]--UDP-N-acetylglucosamine O-acyltransferase [Bacteroidales bacterium]
MEFPLTSIHPNAKIGKGTTVEPFTVIHDNTVIGENCWIGSNVSIMNGARIGNNVRIFPGAVISAVPQDLKFDGEETTAEIGDNTTIRECVTVNRGTKAAGKTVIGQNCLLMAYVHVAHDCIIGDHCIFANTVTLAGHVEIGDHTVMGGFSGCHQFVKVGKHVMIRSGALVMKDVPPFITAGREPVVYLGLNTTGLKRRGFTAEKIDLITDMYRTLYLSGNNTSQAVPIIEEKFEANEERAELLNFIKNADRGIIRAK